MVRYMRQFCCLLAVTSLLLAGYARAGTTLTVLANISGNNVPAAEALAEAFMKKNPDVKIDIETRQGGAPGDNLVKTRLATGVMSDVFIYNSGSLLQALKPGVTMADVSDLPCMELIDESFKQVVSVDGKIYGVPFGMVRTGGILYNKKIYEELGLSIPKTWAEFMANCEKIKASGKAVPVIQTYRTTWTSQLLFLADYFNLQAAVPNFAEEYTANRAKFATTPAALKGFQRLADVHNAGFLNADYGAATYNDGLLMLALGEGAHYPMLSHALSAIKQDAPENLDDIGFFAQPSDDPEINGLTMFMPNAVYIPANTPNLEVAKKFLDFIASPEGAEIFMEINGAQGPPIIKGAELPADTPSAVYDMLPYFESGNAVPGLEFVSPVKGPALEQITVEVGSGMRSPEDAAALYDEDVRKQAKQLGLPGW